jgi:DNA repair protein RadC
MSDEQSPEYHATIHDLPDGERPRERLELYGAEALSTAELLAILLRIGNRKENALELATRMLIQLGGLNGLVRARFSEMSEIDGIGRAKAAQIKAGLEMGRRLLLTTPDERPQVGSPGDAANLLMVEMGYLEQEHLRVLLLDTKNRVLSSPTVYRGNVNTSVIRIAEVFREAVRQNCPAIIVAHNHPSGDPSPSPEDVNVTRQMVRAGELLDIQVLDHLIIGQGCYVSLKERGLGFD